jgi:hypothetical protein
MKEAHLTYPGAEFYHTCVRFVVACRGRKRHRWVPGLSKPSSSDPARRLCRVLPLLRRERHSSHMAALAGRAARRQPRCAQQLPPVR